MASWKSSQGQKVPGKGYTRAEALGRSQLSMFKDLGRDLRDQSSAREAATKLLRSAGPGLGVLTGCGEQCGLLVSRKGFEQGSNVMIGFLTLERAVPLLWRMRSGLEGMERSP